MPKLTPAALALLVWSPLAAAGAELPRIVDIRVGRHPGYDRLVLELSGDAPAARGSREGAVVLEVGARPLLDHQRLSTDLQRMGPLEIRSVPGGAQIRAEATTRRVRAFRLVSPDRIVVDFGEPGDRPFELEAGLLPLPDLPLFREPGPGFEEPGVGAEPAPGEPEGALPDTGPAPEGAEPALPEGPALEEGVAAEEPPALEPPEGMEPLEAEEPLGMEERPPEPLPLDLEPEEPGLEEPEALVEPEAPVEPEEALEPNLSRIEVALWFAVPFLLAAVFVWFLGSRRQRRMLGGGLGNGDVRPPETIGSREILEATERIDVLEKRIDDEVRSRMQLEERAGRLQEDLKVVQDRMQRLVQRGGPVG
jgi:hypothetical protein